MDDILKSAQEKKYTEFSSAIKDELRQKLASNDTIKQYTSDYDKIQDMKKTFAQITKSE